MALFSVPVACDEFFCLREHPRQGFKIHRVIVGNGRFDFVGKRLGVVESALDLGFRPAQMPGDFQRVVFIIAGQYHDFPDGQRTALDTGLAPGRGVPEVNEREFRATETFLDQPSTGVTGSPAMLACHPSQALSALSWKAHADHY